MKNLVYIVSILLILQLGCNEDNLVGTDSKPSIEIISPMNNGIILDSVTISISAYSPNGVKQVEVYIDNAIVDTLYTAPYRYFWKTTSLPDSSQHTICAKLIDSYGNTNTSKTLTLTCNKFVSQFLQITEFSATQVKLRWQDISSIEDGYTVEMGTDTLNFTSIGNFPPNTTSCTFTGSFTYNQLYYFRVGTKHDSITAYSRRITGYPIVLNIVAPLNNAFLIDSTTVKLSVLTNVQNVEVSLLLDGGIIKTFDGPPYDYFWDLPLSSNNTLHSLRIKAEAAEGLSAYSDSISVTTNKLQPSNLQLVHLRDVSVSLSWQDNSQIESGFVVEMSTDSISYSSIGEFPANTTSCTITAAYTFGTKYYFRVGAKYGEIAKYTSPVSRVLVDGFTESLRVFNNSMGCRGWQTTDGGYVFGGFQTLDKFKICFVKTNKYGDVLWTHTSGWSLDNFGYSYQQTTDGGYIVVGYTMTGGSTGNDIYLVKTDGEGNKVWEKTFGGSGADIAYSVKQTTDGGYIFSGYTTVKGKNGTPMYIVKTDANGNKLWEKSIGGSSNNDCGYRLIQVSDGGFFVFGDYAVSGESSSCIVKLDAQGNMLWRKTNTDFAVSENGIIPAKDGGYLIASNAYIFKIDDSAKVLSKTMIDMPGSVYLNSIQATSDGGYIVGGSTSNLTHTSDCYITKLDGSFNKIWAYSYPLTGEESCASVCQTMDGSYMLTGTSMTGGQAIYIIKTDKNGQTAPY